jgi:regulator of protease activity HflC (stomatin/prohibitin superfamily)
VHQSLTQPVGADTSSPHEVHPERDPFRLVLALLTGLAGGGAAAALWGGYALSNPVLFSAAVLLGVSAGMLGSVLLSRTGAFSFEPPPKEPVFPAVAASADDAANWKWNWSALRGRDLVRGLRVTTGFFGLVGSAFTILMDFPLAPLLWATVAWVAVLCLIGAGIAAAAAHYLTMVDEQQFPEAPELCRLSRVIIWTLGLAGASMGLQLAGQQSLLSLLEIVILLPTAAICYGLLKTAAGDPTDEALPLIPVLRLLGSRTNAVASVLDVAQSQLGIDLRSTWAFTVVRRGVEPLAIGLCLVGWLTTSLTVINAAEEGLVETLGVPRAGAPLAPGVHLHWPWPIDRVIRIPVKRVQTLTVGHEGQEESGGPEDVLWARAHAANEYTLLLGDGRDLITVDAAVQFRIADARAWHYNSQNPADALRAVAYRAVMRSTVNRTLSDALSENVVRLTGRMRAMVQDDADRLGLGVEVVAFTVGGMHPPVSVAPDYQAVVSAELRKVTDIVLAEAYRNQTLPQAESASLLMLNTARGDGLAALGQGAGEAWSFRALESEYRAAPSEYVFRRRLETLERGLAGRRYVVVDSRVQRDGGELWMTR